MGTPEAPEGVVVHEGPKRLAAKLGASVSSFGGPGGFSIDQLTPPDIAHAFAGTARDGFLVILRKYALDVSVDPELIGLLLCKVRPLVRRWRGPVKAGQVQSLVALALTESVSPMTCYSCEGRAVTETYQPCGPCKGTGRRALGGPQAAGILGIDRSRWTRVWKARYIEITRLLADLEDAAAYRAGGKLHNSG